MKYFIISQSNWTFFPLIYYLARYIFTNLIVEYSIYTIVPIVRIVPTLHVRLRAYNMYICAMCIEKFVLNTSNIVVSEVHSRYVL